MKRYITTSHGMAGHFAIMVWWNNETKYGFWEPYDTGMGRYATIEGAIAEAREWALEERCRYVGPGEKYEEE